MSDKKRSIAVIIPTYRPDETLKILLHRLHRQTCRPDRIFIINTQEEYFNPELIEDWTGVSVFHIEKAQFDHGGTRDLAAHMVSEDLLVYMTMDAVPAGECLLERLAAAFDDPTVACAYARQLPNETCSEMERYTRSFSYGAVSMTKSIEDLPHLGVKTYFCSDVCAAYRRDIYLQLGGFEQRTIFNEDMIYTAKAMKNGYRVRYCADARVIHSHNYTGLQQLHRNFDLGVSQADHPEVFEGVSSESTGIRMVKGCALHLLKKGRIWQIPQLIWQSGCKYLGYRLGKKYRKLPEKAVMWLTMNPQYWKMEK